MKKRLFLLPLLLVVLGCNDVRPPIEGRADPFVPPQVSFASGELRNDTAVGTPILTHNQSGLLTVTVPFRSAIDKTLYVDYSVTFFDENHVSLGTSGPFTKVLEANTPDQITFTSPWKQAADFQMSCRYAR